ncbi:uncharacterized protein LOC143420715 [Maylandia zebra]|uniref:uncharacterized protein LOC143420715 n=1 Tax=Maylandia zebra TaxID=106582 RepID=UPI00403C3636
MDPAASAPPEELREELIDSVSRLVNLWLEHEGEECLRAVEARLQQLISAHSWLLDSLHPLAQDFILNELHLHPPAATASQLSPAAKILPGPPEVLPGPPEVLPGPPEVLPSPPEVLPGRKRRSRRRRITPQPKTRTLELPAVPSLSPTPPAQQVKSIQPGKNYFSPVHVKQRDTPHNIVISPQKLASPETVTHSRASPEAGSQPPADSGPLEIKKPAEDCIRLSLPELGQCSVQLQSALCLPEARAPAGSDPYLPEARAPAGSELCLPEARAPTGSDLCVPGAPVPTGPETVFAGGPEEPVQPPASPAGGPEEPHCHLPRLARPPLRPRLVRPPLRPRLVLRRPRHLRVPNCRLDIGGHLPGRWWSVIVNMDDLLDAAAAFRAVGLQTCVIVAIAVRTVGRLNGFLVATVAVRTVGRLNCLHPAAAAFRAVGLQTCVIVAIAVRTVGRLNGFPVAAAAVCTVGPLNCLHSATAAFRSVGLWIYVADVAGLRK